jgi:predicted ATPase with chaperone activity
VAHCGSTLQGDFAYTVQYTDVSTIWTCLSAQWNKGESATKERISAAIKNLGARNPQKKNQRVVIALAPADLKKEGPAFDLSIALAYLLASKQTKFDPKGKIFLGELALDGSIRPIKGVLALTEEARRKKFTEIYLPEENAEEAALLDDLVVYIRAKAILETVFTAVRIYRFVPFQWMTMVSRAIR